MNKRSFKFMSCILALMCAMSVTGCGKNNENTVVSLTEEVLLADFESWAPDFQLCRISSNFGKVSMNTDSAYVSNGERSARIDPVGNGWMYIPTYSEDFEFDYTDFTYVDGIKVDVYNAQQTEESVSVGFVSALSGIDTFERAGEETFKLAPGWNTVSLYVDPSIVCIIADLTDIQGVYFIFDPINVGDITDTTPRYYLDNLRLIKRATPHSTETNLEFGENEIIDFERFYHKYFIINDFGVDMGIVSAADYGISASSGAKVLRLVVPGTATNAWNYYFKLVAPYLKASRLGSLTDEEFENAYFCWDMYNNYEATFNVVAIFHLGTGSQDYRVGNYPTPGQWSTFRVKLTDIENNIAGWRENMGMFIFSIRDEYTQDREIFFDNFRIEIK